MSPQRVSNPGFWEAFAHILIIIMYKCIDNAGFRPLTQGRPWGALRDY
jgi:hypothetical protein